MTRCIKGHTIGVIEPFCETPSTRNFIQLNGNTQSNRAASLRCTTSCALLPLKYPNLFINKSPPNIALFNSYIGYNEYEGEPNVRYFRPNCFRP
uniref:Uncharacterized protein n=1 Tax=Magallana gigas TaxID=29159 RepID=K1Q0Z5_MAGGI